jgi:hypothetical protein
MNIHRRLRQSLQLADLTDFRKLSRMRSSRFNWNCAAGENEEKPGKSTVPDTASRQREAMELLLCSLSPLHPDSYMAFTSHGNVIDFLGSLLEND